jgi:nucleoside-diphosphate-sugar epimerase
MVLITGSSGFVGKAVCRALHQRAMPYIAAVRRGSAPGQFETGDIAAATDWSSALSGCAAVIHLAARVHVMQDTLLDPLDAYRKVNVDATMNLARQAAAQGVKRFVFVSSVKVNGEETADVPFAAQDTPAPVDPYGQSKLEAERALHALSLHTGMEIVIVRPPLVYGPGVRANFFRLMQLVRLGLPLPLGGIHNRRSMVAIDNLVDLLILCTRHPAAPGQTFLVSDDNDLSIADLIRLIAQAMGKRPILLPIPAKPIMWCAHAVGKAGVASRLLGSLQVDISHTRQVLGWRPVVGTDAAVRQTVMRFLRKPETPVS